MEQVTTERRRSPRQRVLQGGVISFRQMGATIDCTVRNVSAVGACLLVNSPVGIPDKFELVLNRDRTPHHCRVIWRAANKIGVEFE
jgi:hypothetical protein